MAEEIFVNEITGYQLCQNWQELARLAKEQSVIVLVKYSDCIDVGHTLYQYYPDKNSMSFQISGRGISYVYSFSEAEFIQDCAKRCIGFIMPIAKQ